MTNTNTETKKRKQYNTKHRRTQRLYKQIIAYTTIAVVITLAAIWNHYHLSYKQAAKQAVEAINSHVHIVPVAKAATLERLPEPTKTSETVEQMIDRVTKETNFKWPGYLKRLINCENKRFKGDTLDPKRIGLAKNVPAHSKDRGLLMINDYHQKQVTDEQAFDGEWSVRWAINKINAGGQGIWVCNRKVLANPTYYDNF